MLIEAIWQQSTKYHACSRCLGQGSNQQPIMPLVTHMGTCMYNMIVLVTGQHENGGSSSSLTTPEVSTCKGVPTTRPLYVKLTLQ